MSQRKERDRGTRKLTNEQARELIRLHKKGYSFGLLAEKFGIHRTTAFNYATGKRRLYDDD